MALPGEPPKRPASAYFMWLSENRGSVKASLPDERPARGELAKESARRWRALTPADKERYMAAWRSAKERYAQELAAFTAAGGQLPPRAARSSGARQPQQQGAQQHQRQRGGKRKGAPETLEAVANQELLAEVGRRLRDDASFAELVGGALAAAGANGAGGGAGAAGVAGGKRSRRKAAAAAGDAKEGKGDQAAPPTREERKNRTVALDQEEKEEADDSEEDTEAAEIPELTGIPAVVHEARGTVAKKEMAGFSRWLEAGRYDRFLEECQTDEAAVLCRRAMELWANLAEEKKGRWAARAAGARS